MALILNTIPSSFLLSGTVSCALVRNRADTAINDPVHKSRDPARLRDPQAASVDLCTNDLIRCDVSTRSKLSSASYLSTFDFSDGRLFSFFLYIYRQIYICILLIWLLVLIPPSWSLDSSVQISAWFYFTGQFVFFFVFGKVVDIPFRPPFDSAWLTCVFLI